MQSETLTYPSRLYLRDGRRVLCVPADEIVWVEAAGNYVQIHTARKTHLVRHTVKAMEAKLDPDRFVRVRPSAIVSRSSVEALNARHGGDYVVILEGGTEIRSSRGFRDRVESALGDVPGTARTVVATRRRRRATRAENRPAPVEAAPVTPSATPSVSPAVTSSVTPLAASPRGESCGVLVAAAAIA